MSMNIQEATGKKLYWIAINGPSCAMSQVPWRWPLITKPVAEYYIGFPTLKEALRQQQMMLTLPIPMLEEEGAKLKSRKDVACIKMPECMVDEPTDGITVWMETKPRQRTVG